ncbi:hypothetical protein AAFC00_003790 [Neodothiora populina]|uniref:GDP-mannose transporter n=1 Tax=Neodothiora populina TaxID=2781224 RepID=A0ABR3PGJ6_9PEZI
MVAKAVPNEAGIAILSYCGSSILMTVMNKYVLSGHSFNMNFFFLCVQSSVCIITISTLKAMGIINFRDFKTDEAKKWLPVTVLLVGMIYTSTKALRFLSIPVYTIFKNLAIICIAYGEKLVFGNAVTSMALFSFGLMVLSSVIAAYGDIQHALETHANAGAHIATLNAGYLWMFANCFCNAAFVLAMRKRIKITGFKGYDTTFYNELLAIPILLCSSILTEDWSSANVTRNFPPDSRNYLLGAMVLTGLCAVFISYTSAWCVRVTSSTTYSMVGALNKLPLAISGLVFFDAPVTFPSVSAIFVGFVSGLVYALAKTRQSKDANAPVLPTSSNSNAEKDSSKEKA